MLLFKSCNKTSAMCRIHNKTTTKVNDDVRLALAFIVLTTLYNNSNGVTRLSKTQKNICVFFYLKHNSLFEHLMPHIRLMFIAHWCTHSLNRRFFLVACPNRVIVTKIMDRDELDN